MKVVFLSAAFLAATVATAQAGEIMSSNSMSPGSVSAFNGFYGALEYGRSSGDGTLTLATAGGPVEGPFDPPSGHVYGFAAGYNAQFDNFVLGGELRYQIFDNAGDINRSIDNTLDARARAGVAFDRFMAYGAVGWSWASVSNTVVAGDPSTINGMNYGFGVEYNVTEQIMIGVDYTVRSLSGDLTPAISMDTNANSLTARIGYRF